MKRLSVRIEDGTAEQLAAEAARRGMSEAEVVRLAVRHLLEQEGPAAAAGPGAPRPASAFGMRVEELKRHRRTPI